MGHYLMKLISDEHNIEDYKKKCSNLKTTGKCYAVQKTANIIQIKTLLKQSILFTQM